MVSRRCRILESGWVVALGIACLLLSPAAGAAQDGATVSGALSAPPGATLEVPVYARDVSATPIGVDQPAGSRIQSLSYKVTFTPASSVASKLFARAGITAGLTPTFQATPSTATTASYLGTFDESTDPIPFTLDAASPGDQVLKITVTLAAAAPAGTIDLTLDPTTTLFANQAGSTEESLANGWLALTNGAITVLSNAASALRAYATSSAAIQLDWNDPNQNETGFRLERSTDSTSWSTVTTLGANDTTYLDTTGLAPATLYYYRLVTLVPADSHLSNPGFASTFPATAAKVCVQRLPGGDATWARYPSAAWNDLDDEWGVVWEAREDGVQDEIFFQRLDSTTLAPIGGPVNVSQSAQSSQLPTLVWNGAHYLVVWYEHQRREPGSLPLGLGTFALLEPDGTIVRRGVTSSISSLVGWLRSDTRTPLSWDGTNWGFLTTEVPTTHPFADVFYRRLSESGDVVLGPSALTATPGHRERNADLAYNSTAGVHGAAWDRQLDDTEELFFQRFEESTGATLGSPQSLGTLVSGADGLSTLSNGADGWVVAWGDWATDVSDYALYLRKVDASGVPTGSANERLSDAAPALNFAPSLHHRPDGGFVVMSSGYGPSGYNYEIVRAEADSSGAKDGPVMVISPDDGISSYLPKVAEDGSRFLVVWNESDPSGSPNGLEVSGLLVDADGMSAPGPKVDLTTGHTPSTTVGRPAPGAVGVQPLGAGFVALWTDPAHPGEIRARVWDGSGAAVNTFLPLNSAPLAGSVAFVAAGETFAVLWRTLGDLRFARYDANGYVVLEQGISTASGSGFTLGFDGESYVALIRSGSNFLFRKIAPDGNPLGSEIIVPASSATVPRLLWTGSGWAVLWRGSGANQSLYFMLVARDGTVLVPATLVVPRISPWGIPQFAMAWNGGQMGLAWAQRKNALSPPGTEIYFTRLNLNGTTAFPETTVVSTPYDDTLTHLYWANGAFRLIHVAGDRSTGFREIAIDPNDGAVLPGERFWSNRTGGSAFAWNGVTLGMLWTQNNLLAAHFQTGACVEDPSPPPCPALSVASAGNLVRLTWPAVADAQSGIWRYQVIRDGTHLAELDPGSTQWDDAGYVTGATHSYELLAMNGAYQESEGCAPVAYSTTAGDANGDGSYGVADIFYLINYFFADGPPPLGNADANGDDAVTVSDIFYMINNLFSGGPSPVPIVGGEFAAATSVVPLSARRSDLDPESAIAVAGRSRLIVGSATAAPGATVRIPIDLVDRPDTPLGPERPFGDRVQALALTVRCAPCDGIAALALEPAGPLARHEPTFESRPGRPGQAALVTVYDEATAPLFLGLSSSRLRQRVATLVVQLAPSAPAGTTLDLRLDPGTTLLANQAGTTHESAPNGWLELADGRLAIGSRPPPGKP